MAGTLRGKIEAYITEDNEFLRAGVVFKNIYDWFDAHPNTTLVSLGYGTAGTGTDYPDGPNPFDDDAHFVFRFNAAGDRTWPFYIFVTVGAISSTSGAPSNIQMNGFTPTSGNGTVVASMAVGIGGDENPYNGTQNADGTDTKPTQIWANPSGGTNVFVTPASNSTSGSDGTNKNNCFQLFYESQPDNPVRYNIVGDDDGVVFFWDQDDSGLTEFTRMGAITPGSRFTYDRPFYGFYESGALLDSAISENDSGVSSIDIATATWQVAEVQLGWPSVAEADFQPNAATGGYDAFPVGIGTPEAAVKGFRGTDTLMLMTYGAPAFTLSEDRELIVWGQVGATSTNPVFPWDGTTLPRSGTTRAGIDWTR